MTLQSSELSVATATCAREQCSHAPLLLLLMMERYSENCCIMEQREELSE
jgi:hypothetical protein